LQTGFYLDVGANHPFQISNTYRLYAAGMRGICVEPNDMLADLHQRVRPEDILLRTVVGPTNGLQRFYELSYHGVSTASDEELAARQRAGATLLKTTYKPMLRLDTLLETCRLPGREVFSFLSVDTEGWDEMVLNTNDWNLYRPQVVIVEANDEASEASISNLMNSKGYRLEKRFAVNLVFRPN
jgi:FkbM family methyltransferase